MHHLKTASLKLFVVGKDALSSFISLLITQYLLLIESWHIVIYCKKNLQNHTSSSSGSHAG